MILKKLPMLFIFIGFFAYIGSFSTVSANQSSSEIVSKAEALIQSGDYNHAQQQLQKAITAQPGNESLWDEYNIASGRKYVAGWAAEEMRWAPIDTSKFVEEVILGKKIALIDVRSPLETSVWHPESKRFDIFLIPLQNVPSILQKIHPEKYDEIIFICPTGVRAASASLMAAMMGYENVYFFKGGYKALTSISGNIYRETEKKLIAEGKIKGQKK